MVVDFYMNDFSVIKLKFSKSWRQVCDSHDELLHL